MFQKIKIKLKTFLPTGAFLFLLVMPASTNYQLKDYGFGTGGTGKSDSTNYSMTAITGEQSGAKAVSTNYGIGSGLIFTNQANVPEAPTFTNPSNYYNKLQIILNTSSNPTDTKFAISISTDNFASNINYVQSDHTIGAVLGSEDYQTYASWGSAGGTTIIGLAGGTTYQVKVKAMQGRATETGYGPLASAATTNPTLSFGITSSNTVNFGDLIPGSVNNSPQNVSVSFETNAANGGRVYVTGANGGLHSSAASYDISSTTGNLAALPGGGFGAQGVTGGTLALVSPYDNLSGDNVGIVDQNVREIFSAIAPIVGGTGIFTLKARPASTAPAASDYAETLTIVAAGSF